MKNELLMAINQIASGKELPKEMVTKALEEALASAFKKEAGLGDNSPARVSAKVDLASGSYHIYVEKNVVETVKDPRVEVSLAEARKQDPQAQVGGKVVLDCTPSNFGRIAAQSAKQIIIQRLHEAEREVVHKYLAEREGEIVIGLVQAVDYNTGAVTVKFDRGEGVLEKSEQIPTERYRVGSKVRVYIAEVHRGNRGPVVKLSRTHRQMLYRLLEQEIPEIHDGIVEIKAIAREPGYRSKVAVAARDRGVDPVGSCVGMRGTRIQNVVNELNGEKIDVVEWSADTATFIANALSPAKVTDVILQEDSEGKTAIVIVPDRQLSLAIGKEGQNARLAAKLTGWRIDIKSETEAAEEGLNRLVRTRAATLPPGADLLAVAEAILREKEAAAAAQFAAAQAAVESQDKATPEEAALPTQAETPTEVAPVAPVEVAPVEPQAAVPAPEEPAAAEAAAPALPEAEVTTEAEAELEFEPEVYEEEVDFAEGEEEEEDKGKPRGKKKAAKKRTLVYDERSGEVVAVRRRKPGRSRGWDMDEEY